MKKALLSLIAMVLVLFSSSMLVMAETDYLNYGNWIGYENSDGTLTIVGCRSLEEYVHDGILTIPSEVEGMTVTRVDGGSGLLDYYFDIFSPELVESLVLADTITYIDSYVFENFVNLTKVVFPNNSDLELGYDLFGNSEKVTDITRRDYLSSRSINYQYMTTLTIHEGVTNVSVSEYEALTTVNLPSTTTSVYFWKNPNLTTVNCDKDISSICVRSTEDCPKLCIPVHVFETADFKASGQLPGSFRNSGVTSVTIDAAFLTNDYMKKDTFKDCSNLTAINVNGESNFYSQDGVLFWKKHLFAYPAAKSSAVDYTVPNFVECIYVYAFSGCQFTSITVPEDIPYSYYWDYSVREQYQDENGEWQTRDAKLLTHLPNTTLRVIQGSPACDVSTTKANISSEVGTTEAKVEFYLGTVHPITYELNGGTNHPDNPTSHQVGAAPITLKDPIREGYTFLGWKRNDISYGYVNTTEYRYSKNFTYDYIFTAEWEEKGKVSFEDVADEKSYYYKPVYWAVENNITSGYTPTHFAPNMACTRGQVVTFLWRTANKPEPSTTTCKFTDVSENAYYRKAVLWAVEEGITSGLTDTLFGPDVECSRAQIVTFMWRFADKPEPKTLECPFIDVADTVYYRKAVLWAVENGITSGYSADYFAPDLFCTRGQIVSFLYRAYRQ